MIVMLGFEESWEYAMKKMRILISLACLSFLGACDQVESTQIGGRYAAKLTCSCIFVMESSEEACSADLIGGARSLPLSIDYDQHSVEAGLPFLKGKSHFEEGKGCWLE